MWHLWLIATGAKLVKSWQESLYFEEANRQIHSRDKHCSLLCTALWECICMRSVIFYGWVVVSDQERSLHTCCTCLSKKKNVFYLTSQPFHEMVLWVQLVFVFAANNWQSITFDAWYLIQYVIRSNLMVIQMKSMLLFTCNITYKMWF